MHPIAVMVPPTLHSRAASLSFSCTFAFHVSRGSDPTATTTTTTAKDGVYVMKVASNPEVLSSARCISAYPFAVSQFHSPILDKQGQQTKFA